MKRLILLFLAFSSSLFAAPSPSPEAVVRTAIVAAQKDQLSLFVQCVDLSAIANRPRHSMSPAEVVRLLKNIPEKKIKFSAISLRSETALVRMTQPLALDFELTETKHENGSSFVISAIHP